MYCFVIFGKKNHATDTRYYLYRCGDEFKEGDLVDVRSKDTVKVALLCEKFDVIPADVSIEIDKIKNVQHETKCTLSHKDIKALLLGLIDLYKLGKVSKEDFCIIADGFICSDKLHLERDSRLEELIRSKLTSCLSMVNKYENDDKNELEFWKSLKQIESSLYSIDRDEEKILELIERLPKIKKDPVEQTDEYISIELELERLIKKEIGDSWHCSRGFGYVYTAIKKRILKERYGIEWKNKMELNPDVIFD